MRAEYTEGSTCAVEVTGREQWQGNGRRLQWLLLRCYTTWFLEQDANHASLNRRYQIFTVVPVYGESSRQKVAVVAFARFSVHVLIGFQRRTFGIHKNRDIIWRVTDYPVPPAAFLHTIIRILTAIFCIHKRCRRLLHEITGLHTSTWFFRSSISISKTGLNTKWPKTNLRLWTHHRTQNVRGKPPKLMGRSPHIVRSKGGQRPLAPLLTLIKYSPSPTQV